jgi:hypothetical protein
MSEVIEASNWEPKKGKEVLGTDVIWFGFKKNYKIYFQSVILD